MNFNVTVLSIFITLLCFILFLTCSLVNYQLRKNEKYNFGNKFPDEILEHQKPASISNISFYLMIGSLVLSAVSFSIPFFQYYGGLSSTHGMILILTVFGGLSPIALCINQLCFPIYKVYKKHLVSYVIFLCLELVRDVLSSFFLIRISNGGEKPIVLALGIAVAALALLHLIAYLNPRLKNWYFLSRQEEADGEVLYMKNPLNPLSIAEWISIFVSVSITVLFLISLILFFN